MDFSRSSAVVWRVAAGLLLSFSAAAEAQPAANRTHWAYQKPAEVALPKVVNEAWIQTPIDRFVLARLEAEKLSPSPKASLATLMRRVSLDLIGLPPTPEEIAEVLSDPRPGAYERWVERLLASPHYGERWARPWLDQARYADSNGYEADHRRSIWPYRDWVIGAFNADMPFDQFTIEQLAGDLLPNPTRQQKIATGFHRNTLVNTEGGTDDEEFRVAAVVDRLNTTFEVWMGTTIGCAQCHNHKYDPFTQKEYYQLFAILNQTKDRGRNNDPQLDLATAEQEAKRAEIRKKIEPLQKILDSSTPELEKAQAAWEQPHRERSAALARQWFQLSPETFQASQNVELQKLGDQSLLAKGPLPENSDYEITFPAPKTKITALKLAALIDASLPNQSSGRSEDGDFVLTEFELETVDPAGQKTARSFDSAYADFSMEKYSASEAIDGKPATGWSIAAHEPANRGPHEAVFILKEPVESAGKWVIRLKHQSVRTHHLIGRFQVWASTAPAETHKEWAKVPDKIRGLLTAPLWNLSEEKSKELSAHYRSIAPALEPTRKQIAELKKQEPKDVPTTLVLEAIEKPRETHFLVRGSHLNKGDVVTSGLPAVLHRAPEGELNRLTFAQWLVSPENPLVGRVTMNRIWAQYFGRGLVETSEEFGAQGEPPSHPELLDWLALELVRQQWRLKAMHRMIVLSAVYQQSAAVSPELYERDPYNRLLARGPRFRMEAEMLRDAALAASGLLDRRLGGPSVFPHQPEGIWNFPYNEDAWKVSAGGNQFRRGLYTFWRRSAPYPTFMAFDAPSREVCAERRARSNTPVQALATLNDAAFMAPAAALAQRMIAAAQAPRERLAFGLRAVLAREPEEAELSSLLRLQGRVREELSKNPKAAESLAAPPGINRPAGNADWVELGSWTVISNVLLNLDEALTKG